MKTDELIGALVTDRRQRIWPMSRTIYLAALVGGLLALAPFIVAFGVRPDFAGAAGTWRFDLKLAIVAVALVLALIDCVRLANPSVANFASLPSLLIPLLILGAIGLELVLAPADTWTSRLVGTNAIFCLVAIPALALAPLAAGMWAMRSGAPASPALAGAAVGRLAAAIAAALYALHCFDDSPLFVATWYTLGTLPVIVLGSAIGRRFLRW